MDSAARLRSTVYCNNHNAETRPCVLTFWGVLARSTLMKRALCDVAKRGGEANV